jgi:hypothetical protein
VWPAAARCRTGRHHGVDLEPPGHPAHAHDRRARGHLGSEVRLVVGGGNEDQPVGPAGRERRRQCPLAPGVAVDARREHDHPARHGDVLHRTQDRRAERVGDVVEEQPDRRRAGVAAAQHTGTYVRMEAQVVDGLPDAPDQRG